MKTAVSLPDELFKKAERISERMQIPRSRLFARALQEYIDNHRRDEITERLNEIYGKNSQKETDREIPGNTARNDTW